MLRKSMETMLTDTQTKLPRLEGNGWSFPKIHAHLKIPTDIHDFARPSGYDTFNGEHLLQDMWNREHPRPKARAVKDIPRDDGRNGATEEDNRRPRAWQRLSRWFFQAKKTTRDVRHRRVQQPNTNPSMAWCRAREQQAAVTLYVPAQRPITQFERT